MKFTIAAVLVAATAVTADHLDIRVPDGSIPSLRAHGNWYTDDGTEYYIDNVDNGCHNFPGVPGLTKLCIDYMREHADFYFDKQSRRCLKKGPDSDCSKADDIETCSTWAEVRCSW